VAVGGNERACLEIELALAKSRLETLNKLVLKFPMGEIRRGLRYDVREQETRIAEIERKLAEP